MMVDNGISLASAGYIDSSFHHIEEGKKWIKRLDHVASSQSFLSAEWIQRSIVYLIFNMVDIGLERGKAYQRQLQRRNIVVEIYNGSLFQRLDME
jgi:hypothetical protein